MDAAAFPCPARTYAALAAPLYRGVLTTGTAIRQLPDRRYRLGRALCQSVLCSKA